MYTHLFANCAVADLPAAERWYTAVFERGPDARPMAGLLEWHLEKVFGVQVWADAERAGQSTVVLGVADLDAAAIRLRRAGIEHDGPQPGGGARLLMLADPDGNRVVFTGR